MDEQERIIGAIAATANRIRTKEACRDKLHMVKAGLMDDLLTERVRVAVPLGTK